MAVSLPLWHLGGRRCAPRRAKVCRRGRKGVLPEGQRCVSSRGQPQPKHRLRKSQYVQMSGSWAWVKGTEGSYSSCSRASRRVRNSSA